MDSLHDNPGHFAGITKIIHNSLGTNEFYHFAFYHFKETKTGFCLMVYKKNYINRQTIYQTILLALFKNLKINKYQ